MGDDAQGKGPRPRVGQGQAGGQPRPRRRRIDGRQPQRALDLLGQDDRRRILRRRVVPLLLTPQPVAGQPGEPDRQIAARGGGRFAVHDPTP